MVEDMARRVLTSVNGDSVGNEHWNGGERRATPTFGLATFVELSGENMMRETIRMGCVCALVLGLSGGAVAQGGKGGRGGNAGGGGRGGDRQAAGAQGADVVAGQVRQLNAANQNQNQNQANGQAACAQFQQGGNQNLSSLAQTMVASYDRDGNGALDAGELSMALSELRSLMVQSQQIQQMQAMQQSNGIANGLNAGALANGQGLSGQNMRNMHGMHGGGPGGGGTGRRGN